MNPHLLSVYHRLPPRLRSVSATVRGMYLRSWRYTRHTDHLVRDARDREAWSAEEVKRYSQRRLAYVLDRAARHVPFYREMWAARRRRGDHAAWDVLEHWPILEKATIRRNPRAFIADDCRPWLMFHEHTSGTTGSPLDLWRTRRTLRAWYALSEARWRQWYGVSAADRWAILGGQLVTPAAQRDPPFWVWNQPLNQLYMSSYHLSPALAGYYLDALDAFKIRYLWGYPSAISALAREAERLGYCGLGLAVAVANAEPVLPYQRELVARVFGCALRETYGMAEYVAAAGECEAGRMHLWPEVGFVEVFDHDRPVGPDTPGDLVCTSLLDADMPLIRYRVGDRGNLASGGTCECGRHLPVLASVEGRRDDMLVTPDGRLVGRLDPVFKAALPIREAQIVQRELDHVHVQYVPDVGFTRDAAEQIAAGIRARMAGVRVTHEAVASIPRTANGKFRAVVSLLSPQQVADATAVEQ